MGEFAIEREGLGRRPADQECSKHRELTDTLQTTVDKNSGRWSAMLWFLGIIGFVLSAGMGVLISKTSDIQTTLNRNDVTMMQHTEKINSQQKEIDEIKTRNRYIDQQSSMKSAVDKVVNQ